MRKCKKKADIVSVLAEVRKEGLLVDAVIATAAMEALARRAQQLRTRTSAGERTSPPPRRHRCPLHHHLHHVNGDDDWFVNPVTRAYTPRADAIHAGPIS